MLNTIHCADSQEFIKTIPDNLFDLVILDPPYMTTKEKWDNDDPVDDTLILHIRRVMKDTASLYLWCGLGEKSQSLIKWYPLFAKHLHFKQIITWKKQRGIGMVKGWLYTREEILWFVKDNKKFVWNTDKQYTDVVRNSIHNKARSGFYRHSNVWTDITEESFAVSNKNTVEQKFHYTPKPRKALTRIIEAHTKEGDVVLDCFSGSGQTAVVCKEINRQFVCVDISPEFVRLSQNRLVGK